MLDLLSCGLPVLWQGLRTCPHQDTGGVLWCREGAAAPLKGSGESGLCVEEMKWGEEILGWQRACGQSSVGTVVVKKKDVASETCGSLAGVTLRTQTGQCPWGRGQCWKDPCISATGPGLDSQRSRLLFQFLDVSHHHTPEPSARGKVLSEMLKAVRSSPGLPCREVQPLARMAEHGRGMGGWGDT